MNKIDLDTPIMKFLSPTGITNWTIQNAFENTQVFGGVGSGKTSSSGRMLAINMLSNNFGGLVLTSKADEKENWIEYCRLTGRENDLYILEPNGHHRFNFLQYEAGRAKGSTGFTENIVDVLKTVIKASQDTVSSNDGFWQSALDMLLLNVINLANLANETITVEMIYNIAQTLPREGERITPGDGHEPSAFYKAYTKVKDEILNKVAEWENSLSENRLKWLQENAAYDAELYKVYPEARVFKYVDQFFIETLRNLNSKTRSIIDFTLNGFLFRLLQEPVFSMFCDGVSTINPDICTRGKIILVDLPVLQFNKVGRDCQILMKYIFQRAMQRRKINDSSLPVFLFADESQLFIHEHDAEYQTTARSSRVATVYITQNIHNYFAAMGGDKSDHRVKGFLGTMATKIFHANADVETNKYASDLIGEEFFTDQNETVTMSGKFSQSRGRSEKLQKVLRPEDFVQLKTGGITNNYEVEAIIHRQGNPLRGKRNFLKLVFSQKWQPETINNNVKPIKQIKS